MDIVLLGGSNSVVKNGLRIGLEAQNIRLHNYALGFTGALQNLYELIRHQDTIQHARLVITESNINDFLSLAPTNVILDNINRFYEKLYTIHKKIVVLILPIHISNQKSQLINLTHRQNCSYYGFNSIDVDLYYQNHNLYTFDKAYQFHPMPIALQELGKNIIKHLALFKESKCDIPHTYSQYAIYKPSDYGQQIQHRNSFFHESAIRIPTNQKVFFPKEFLNYQILGLHTWNKPQSQFTNSTYITSLSIENKTQKIIKNFGFLNSFQELQREYLNIDTQCCFYVNKDILPTSEESNGLTIDKQTIRLDFLDLIGILLAKTPPPQINFKKPTKKNNFDFIIPPIVLYKSLIDEYKELTLLQEKSFLKNQNSYLMSFLNHKDLKKEYEIFLSQKYKIYGAAKRIKDSLNYKIGEAIILYDKSHKNFFKLCLELIEIYRFHSKQKGHLKSMLPLKYYTDYKEAQVAKTHLPYLLGSAFIKASKSPLKIAFLTLPFKLKKIAKNYKKKI
ncbi:hypothetical protein [Helicobacter turcicus]|uniref:SGNH/GDSL hydrolase family protein n=1 Tax=Helicobacter turcicus TaxID=2867412 RepID=A0ABS7JM69_9HELI|nr:hypothetical protein [Helicobacter turcicus]MBX7490499.1 hypothetical protein [Helicobacter turcicus]MBX7545359.1 hypothetical protein [Helicobacter turcicus]